MNERIRALLKEAGFCFWEDEEWGPGVGYIDWGSGYDEQMNKFITLLVNECARLADGVCEAYDAPGTQGKIIKGHFGVEE